MPTPTENLGDTSNILTFPGDIFLVIGGDGNNTLTFTAGGDWVTLGNGDNTLIFDGSGNQIALGSGNNTITISGTGVDTITVTGGNDIVALGDSAATIQAGDGQDTLTTGDGDSQIVVGDGAGDAISVGSGTNDITIGIGSDDVVQTAAGNTNVFIAAAAVAGDSIMGALTSGDGTTNALKLITSGLINPTNVSGFDVYQLANLAANTLTLTDTNFARLPSDIIAVDEGTFGDTINATTLSVGKSFNVAGANDTINLATGDYLGLIGGAGRAVNGSADTIAAAANTSFNLPGGNDTVTLGGGSYIGLIGGSGYAVTATSATIVTSDTSGGSESSGDVVSGSSAQLMNTTVYGFGAGVTIDVKDIMAGATAFALGYSGNDLKGVLSISDGAHSTQIGS